jgi:hypothetical protein
LTNMESLFAEQQELVSHIDAALTGLGGYSNSKLRGDICCRVVMDYLSNHVPETHRIVGPNAWVAGFPTEFDLAVVTSDARPERFSAIYPAEGVRLLIEVKQSGVFARRDELRSKLERVYKDFQAVSTLHEHISWLYLTVREVTRPKKPRSIDFLALTRHVLGNDRVACLRDSRTRELLRGEWDRAVDLVVGACMR